MRALAMLLLATIVAGAELEQITTTDGRRFIGYYNADASTLTIEGPPKAVIKITAAQIADRAPYIRAIETDPVKRDESALVQLEAERDAAIAEAARLRAFASTRSGKDAEVALSQANERAELATKLTEKISAISARLIAAKPAAPSANKPGAAPAASAPPTVNSYDAARKEAARGMAEVHELRDRAAVREFDVLVQLLKSSDLTPMKVPELGADPRTSEIEARTNAVRENNRRQDAVKALEESKKCVTTEAQERWSRRVMQMLDDQVPSRSAARIAEEEEVERKAKEQRQRNEDARAGKKR